MSNTNDNHFTDQQIAIAKIAKALGHPARVAIIAHLLKVNACICSDIVEELPLAQSTISQHLKALKNAGLIKGSIEGTSICYCIDESNFRLMKLFLSEVIGQVSTQNCC